MIPTRRALLLLGAGLFVLLNQAFIPFDEFVHRGDDAFYYFKVAANYPEAGFWSFDGVQSTNGVQPLWAIVLTAVAQIAAWAGLTDPHLLARLFIAVAALVQFAAAVVLFRLLAAQLSVGTALAAAGAFVFPLGLVWGRMWGLEAPLLALALVTTVAYYHMSFGPRPSARGAAVLGILLGVTCLSRLNAGLLIPCLLAFHLLNRGAGPLANRFRDVMIAGGVASLLIVPYLVWNLADTGHLLPISGQVKSIGVARALEAWESTGSDARQFASYVYWNWKERVEWFVTSRLLDGMWIAGVRLVHDGSAAWRYAIGLVAALLLAPMLLGQPREWLRFLAARFRRLTPFTYFVVFAVLDALVAVSIYPTQTYAIPRWWLIASEIVLIVIGATLTVAAIAYVAERLVPAGRRAALATSAVALLIGAHVWQTGAYYWDGQVEFRDWNTSWNDESYRAAQWINSNVPEGELVGSWNAGIVGFYARRQVVNLDGLINNRELLPYLQDRRVEEYILERRLRYLSDIDGMFKRELTGRLALTEVYSRHSPLMNSHYRIYRVDGPARDVVAEAGR